MKLKGLSKDENAEFNRLLNQTVSETTDADLKRIQELTERAAARLCEQETDNER